MRRIACLFLVLLAAAVPALAQNLTPVELPDGYTIDVPDGFELIEDADTGLMSLTDGETSIDVYLPSLLAESVEWDNDAEPAEILASAVTTLFEFEDPTIDEIEIAKNVISVWNWSIDDDDLSGTSYLIQLDDETYALVDIYA
ncbi:MAG: hypothetical protein K8I30_00460, partial [Anaerolineae bacterium]|nr:hypothetical protein [Anaerolineae bacterium]